VSYVDSLMYTIFKLVKTKMPRDESRRTSRDQDWVLTWVETYQDETIAKEGLRVMITEDPDPASDWLKRKTYFGATYDQYIRNKNNYHHRKYFLVTPTYTLEHLERELKACVRRAGMNVV